MDVTTTRMFRKFTVSAGFLILLTGQFQIGVTDCKGSEFLGKLQ